MSSARGARNERARNEEWEEWAAGEERRGGGGEEEMKVECGGMGWDGGHGEGWAELVPRADNESSFEKWVETPALFLTMTKRFPTPSIKSRGRSN